MRAKAAAPCSCAPTSPRVDDARAVVAAAERAFGRVDALVNAAGITDRGTIFDTSPELFDRMVAVNLRAPFFLMQEAAKLMRRERVEGAMVNILSMSAHGGQPFLTPYSMSKGALATLTRNAAFSLMPWRIRVNALNIGWMNTPGEDRIMRTVHGATDGWLEKAAAEQPFGRLIEPDEVARACAFLCSAEFGADDRRGDRFRSVGRGLLRERPASGDEGRALRGNAPPPLPQGEVETASAVRVRAYALSG